MKEFEFVRWIADHAHAMHPQVQVGIGDDAAVMQPGDPNSSLVICTDMLVEGVHFSHEQPCFSFEAVGRKALAVNMSDLAAMGAVPECALVSIVLPRGPKHIAEQVMAGVIRLAKSEGIALIGGDTNSWRGGLAINVTLMGRVPVGAAVRRCGARVDDCVMVTGELGGSLSGKHFNFIPRVREGLWLREREYPTAMIDISDGLVSDLGHICAESNLGAIIEAQYIPISSHLGPGAMDQALGDGEDFELCFTVAAGRLQELLQTWGTMFPETRLSCIGQMKAEPGVLLRDEQGDRLLKKSGYEHQLD